MRHDLTEVLREAGAEAAVKELIAVNADLLTMIRNLQSRVRDLERQAGLR